MENFTEIIEAARQGEGAAIRILIKRYRFIVESEIYRRAALLGSDLSQADLHQEVWLRVWLQIHQFRGAESDSACEPMFRAWLRQTARHVVINQITRRNAQKRAPKNGLVNEKGVVDNLIDDQDTVSRVARQKEDAERIQRAIDAIDNAADKQIITARFFEGESIADIAQQLGLTYEQTRYRFNRALEQIRVRLAEI